MFGGGKDGAGEGGWGGSGLGGVDDKFMGLVDDLVVMSENDTELAEGLRWIDAQSQKNGVTFYEMALMVLRKHMAERRAKEWLHSKRAAAE